MPHSPSLSGECAASIFALGSSPRATLAACCIVDVVDGAGVLRFIGNSELAAEYSELTSEFWERLPIMPCSKIGL